MLRQVLFSVLFLGLFTRIRCFKVNGELDHALEEIHHEIDELKSQVHDLHQCHVDVHVHGDAEAHEDDPRTVNINLHGEAEHHEDDHAADAELYHRDDIYGVANFHNNGEPGNHVDCKMYFAQHRTSDHADWRIECSGFPKHEEKDHHVYMLPGGDLTDTCHSIDHPDHHDAVLIGDVRADDKGHIDVLHEHSSITMKGDHSIFGKAFAIYDIEDKGLALACGLVGHADFSAAYEVLHGHWAEAHPYTENDLFGHVKFHSAPGSHVHGDAHIEQYRDGHFPAEIELDLEGFSAGDHHEYELVLHQHLDISGDCQHMGDYDPGHHHSDHVGKMTPDSDGNVHHLFDHDDLTMKGKDSIIGHAFGIHAEDNSVVACGVIGWSTFKDEAASFHHETHTEDHA